SKTGVEREMPNEHVLGVGVKKDPVARAHYGLAPPGQIPRSTNSWRPVSVVRLVQAPLSHQNRRAGRGIDVRKVAVLFLDQSVVVVAQSKIQHHVLSPVVAV